MAHETILIIEDDAIQVIDLEQTLIRLGYTVMQPAASGQAALERLSEGLPDLVLMDIDLPGDVSGIATAVKLREIADIPVIYLTAYSQPSLVSEALPTVPYGYLVKPVAERELQAAIQIALTKHAFDLELKHSEEKFQKAFRSNPALMAISTIEEGRFVEVNDIFLTTMEYERAEVIGRTSQELNIFSDYAQRRQLRALVREQGFVKDMEITMLGRHGQTHCGLMSVEIIELEGQRHLLTTFNDITERKQAQEALQTSEARYRNLFENMAQGVVYHEADGHITAYNPAALSILGLSADQITGRTAFDPGWKTIHEDLSDFPGDDHPAMVALRTGEPVNDVIMGVYNPRSMRHRWIIASARPEFRAGEDKPYRVFSTFTDITERKEAADNLRRSQEWLRYAQQAAQIGFWDWDMPSGKLTWSDEFFVLFGLPPTAEPSFDAWSAVLHPEDRQMAFDIINKAIDEEAALENEYRIILPDGQLRWILALGTTQYDSAGRALRMSGTCLDITQRKQAEEALRASETRMRSYFELPLIGIAITSLEKGWLEVNDRLCAILGYTRDELIELTWAELTYPEDLATDVAQFNRVVAGEIEGYSLEKRFIRKGGQVVWAELSVRCVRRSEGSVEYFVALVQDISARKQVEESLRISEEMFVQAFQHAPLLMSIRNLEDETYIDVNETFTEISGFTHAETIGRTPIELGWFSSVERGRFIEALQEQGQVKGMELALRAKDGRTVVCSYSGQIITIGGARRLLSLAEDITERKNAEEALRSRTEELDRFFSVTLDLLCIAGTDGRFRRLNRAWERTLGYTTAELTAGAFFDFIHPDDLSSTQAAVAELANQHEVANFVNRYRCRDGSYRWLEWRSAPSGDTIYAAARDITERRQAEAALREMNERLEATLNALPDLLFEVDRHGVIFEYRTPEASDLYLPPERFLGRSVAELLPPDATEQIMLAIAEAAHTGRHRGSMYCLSMPSGLRWYEASIVAKGDFRAPDARFVALVRDITARKQMEEALRESEKRVRDKLESVLSPASDIGALDLADIIDTQSLQATMDYFYDLTHIGIGIVDMHGQVLVATGWQDICTQFYRVHPETNRNCIASDTELSAGVAQGTYKLYRCKNGMNDIATPIVVGGKHIGNLFLGQFFFEEEEPDPDFFRSQACLYGFDEQDFLSALARVPRWSREKVDTVMAFYTRFAQLFSTLSYSNIKLVQSVAQRDQILASLRESEEKYRTIFENATEGIYQSTPQGRYVHVNPAFARILGYADPAEVINAVEDIGRQLYADPAERQRLIELLTQQDRVQGFEIRAYRKDGREIRVSINAYAVRDPQGEIQYIEGTMTDVTERWKAQQALRESEAQLRAIFETSQTAILLGDAQGRLIFANRRMEEMFGYQSDELIGRAYPELLRQEVQPLGIASIAAIARGEIDTISVERRYLRKDGSTFWGYLSAGTMKDEKGAFRMLVASIVDISELKQAEEALRASEDRLRLIFETSHAAIFQVDPQGRVVFANSRMADMFGFAPDELIGQPYPELVHPDQRADGKALMAHLIQGVIEQVGTERHYLRRDGSAFWGFLSGRRMLDGEGAFQGLIGVITDITENKQAQESIRISEEKFRTLFAHMVEGMALHEVIYGMDGAAIDYRILDVNLAHEIHTGLSRDAVIGRTAREAYGTETPPFLDIYSFVAETGRPATFESFFTPLKKHFRISVFSPGTGLFATVFEDITERKRVQAERERLSTELQRKHKELERIVYATSHDLRSPLINIQGFGRRLALACEQVKQTLVPIPLPDEIKDALTPILYENIPKALKFINTSVEKMDSLIKGLLQLSRLGRAALVVEVLDMRKLLERVLATLSYQIQEAAATVDVGDLPTGMGDAAQINQVLSNLIDNAVKYRDRQKALHIAITGEIKDDESIYCVADNGLGIPPAQQDKIWDLFHRLDPHDTAGGEGLGLTLVRTIIERHHGRAWVESVPGQGSRFFFTLGRAVQEGI